MPKVPVDVPQFELNVPSANIPMTRQFGKEGEALSQLGNTAERSGLDLIDQVAKSSAMDAASKAYFQDKLDSDKMVAQLKVQSPDGYMYQDPANPSLDTRIKDPNSPDGYRTITQEFNDWAQERFKASQDSMPNALASQEYKQRARSYLFSQSAALNNDAQVMKVKAFDQAQSDKTDAIGNDLVSNPSLSNFYSSANDLALDVHQQSGTLYNADQANQRVKAIYGSLSKNLLQGAYIQSILNKKDNDPNRTAQINQWKSVLDGTDPISQQRAANGLPTVSSMMDPTQKAIEEQRLLSALPMAKKADLADNNRLLENASSSALQGKMTQQDLGGFLSQLHDQVTTGQRDQQDGGNRATALIASYIYGKAVTPSALLHPSDQVMANAKHASDLISENVRNFASATGMNPNYVGSVTQEKVNEHINSFIRTGLENRDKDFANFVSVPMDQGHNPLNLAGARVALMDPTHPVELANQAGLVQRAIRTTLSQASMARIPQSQITILPKPFLEKQASILTDQTRNESLVGGDLKAMMQAYGKYYPQVMAQMVRDNQLSSGWALLENVNTSGMSQKTLSDMITAIRTPEKSEDPQFEAALSARGDTKQKMMSAVGKQVSNWASGLEQQNGLGLASHNFQAESIRVVGNLAKMYYEQSPGDGIDGAAKKASDQFIGQFYHIVPNGKAGRFWGMETGGIAVIPKSWASDSEMDVITHNIANMMTEDGIKNLHPFVPPLANGKPSPIADQFPYTVANGNPWYVKAYQDGQPGFNIKYQDKHGLQTLFSDPKTPLFIPLDKAKTAPPKGTGLIGTLKKYSPEGLYGQ